jgi:phosphoribosyl-ATP pyrophosphohydrolase/phosphoribosyl-AMP cyclohydrolase
VTPDAIRKLDWKKGDGLLPAIVQDAFSGRVLMLGYMNQEALSQTLERGRIVFFSRSRQALWLKGETSGNYLDLVEVSADCDNDALLLLASPKGPTCHKGTESCFADASATRSQGLAFLSRLESVIENRIAEKPEDSYTARLFAQGPSRIAQKVGEEGLETALATVTRDDNGVLTESADLVFHLLILLKSRNLSLAQVVRELQSRHGTKPR